MVKGDTRASMAAIRLGERRLGELFARFGLARTTDAFERLIAETEREVRDKLRALVPEGSHAFTDTVDSDGQGHGPIKLRYRLDVTADRIVLDTSASDDQVPGPVNFLMSPPVPAMVFGSYLLGEGSDSILNAGVETAIDEVIVRPGSVLQPKFPAPLGMRGVTMMRNMATCLGLLNVATGGRAMAAHSAYVIWYLRGRDDKGELFLLSDGLGVGYGARPTADGNDAVYLVAQENFPSEFLDSVFPVRVLRYAINPDTGGPGRWRGGCGLIREIEVLAPEATVSMRIDSVEHPPWGVAGGHAAGTGRCVVNPGRPDERILRPLSDGNIVRRGDVLRIETGGGGGWGHPFDREPERVLADVRGGFVSRASAEEHYGVVLAGDGLAIDAAATAARRARRPESQALPPSRLPRGARLMAIAAIAEGPRHRRRRHGRHVHRHHPARPGDGPRLERQDALDAGRSFARLRQRHRRGAAGRRALRRRRRPRAARHDHCHQPDPGGQGRAGGAHHHGRLQVRDRDRPPGRAAPRQPVRLGEAEAARFRPSTSSRSAAASAPTAASCSRSTRRRCARPRRRSGRRASARSPSCCCTATPTRRTSGASPPSSPRRCRTRWSRSRARCCPCSASTSAA